MSERHLLRTRDEPVRFFLVPEDADLPTGPLAVRRLDGTSGAVDEDAIRPFEVDAEQAAAHVDAGVDRLLGPMRSAVRDLFGGSEEGAGEGFARWLGVTPGEVMLDRDKRRQGRRTLLEKAGKLLKPTITSDEIERIEGRLDQLGTAVAGEGERLRREGDRLADRLEGSRPAVEAAVQEAADRLTELGQAALGRLGARSRDPEPPPPAPEEAEPVAEPPEDAEEC